MKKFKVKTHFYLGGFKTWTIFAENLESAINKAKAQCPKGFAIKGVTEA